MHRHRREANRASHRRRHGPTATSVMVLHPRAHRMKTSVATVRAHPHVNAAPSDPKREARVSGRHPNDSSSAP